MNKHAFRALCAAFLVTSGSSGIAAAEAEREGIYLRLFGGVSALFDTDLDGPIGGETGFDYGPVVGAAVGYALPGLPLRAEIEYAYRSAEVDSGGGEIDGDFASTNIALNGYYDFGPVGGGKLRPYVGLGLVFVEEIDFDVTRGPAEGEYNDNGVVGYQLMAGADYAVGERWSINGEVRFFDAGGQSLDPDGTGASLKADYRGIDALLGLTWHF